MKKSLFTFVILLHLPLFCWVQPSINLDWIGEPGEEFITVKSTEVPDIIPAGEGVIWDFSHLRPENAIVNYPQKTTFVDVASTLYHDDFPEATTCQYKEYDRWMMMGIMRVREYEYGRASKGGIESLGARIKGSLNDYCTGEMDYSDPKGVIDFPFGYGSVFDDDFAGRGRGIVGWMDTLSISVGSIHMEGDAYGTVILPNGPVENCLRIAVTEDRLDTLYEYGRLAYVVAHVEGYLWLSPTVPGPIATYTVNTREVTSIPVEGAPSTSTFSNTVFTYNPMVVVSTGEIAERIDPGLRIFPNPFLGYVNVQYELDGSKEAVLKIFASDGQLHYSKKLSGAKGLNDTQLNLGHLAPGNYLAVLESGQARASLRLVKVK